MIRGFVWPPQLCRDSRNRMARTNGTVNVIGRWCYITRQSRRRRAGRAPCSPWQLYPA